MVLAKDRTEVPLIILTECKRPYSKPKTAKYLPCRAPRENELLRQLNFLRSRGLPLNQNIENKQTRRSKQLGMLKKVSLVHFKNFSVAFRSAF